MQEIIDDDSDFVKSTYVLPDEVLKEIRFTTTSRVT
jgi:hypothetical protein